MALQKDEREELVKNYGIIGKKSFAQLATLMPDGSPHVSTVWIDHEEEMILVNTAKGRQKDINVRNDPRVSLCILDPDDPYRQLIIHGRVVEITEEGADDHIDKLAKKYLSRDHYPHRSSGEVREIIRIQPEEVIS